MAGLPVENQINLNILQNKDLPEQLQVNPPKPVLRPLDKFPQYLGALTFTFCDLVVNKFGQGPS